MCLKSLWDVVRAFNGRGNPVPLPSYVFITFANPEMISRINEEPDLVVRAIGRCIGVLVVNMLGANINSRNFPVSDDELAYLSTMLGTKGDDVMPLLSQPGAVEFTNTVFLTLDDFYSLALETGPNSLVLDVVHKAFGILTRALPDELMIEIRPSTQMNAFDGQCELVL